MLHNLILPVPLAISHTLHVSFGVLCVSDDNRKQLYTTMLL